jgi:hypothetical protein
MTYGVGPAPGKGHGETFTFACCCLQQQQRSLMTRVGGGYTRQRFHGFADPAAMVGTCGGDERLPEEVLSLLHVAEG